ncbi:hypothetical protein K1719_028518 [Acacia pycnantha]|nr:hypothetical protein K1719_028518 [Acacia pycnantha]
MAIFLDPASLPKVFLLRVRPLHRQIQSLLKRYLYFQDRFRLGIRPQVPVYHHRHHLPRQSLRLERPVLMAPKFGWEDGPDSNFDVTLVLATMLISRSATKNTSGIEQRQVHKERNLNDDEQRKFGGLLQCKFRERDRFFGNNFVENNFCHPTEKDRNQEPQGDLTPLVNGFIFITCVDVSFMRLST